jgi:hypothetical protein
MSWKWIKKDYFELARRVNRDEARGVISHSVNSLDLRQTPDGIRELVRIIYDSLLAREIQYALEPSSSAAPTSQYVRTQSDILEVSREGDCLDLALLFCAVCLERELLPVLIVLDGHAFAAVSLKHDLYAWNERPREELDLFLDVPVGQDKVDKIRELVESDVYLAVECTGFARSGNLRPPYPEGIDRQQDGTLTFERATKAGAEQFDWLHERQFDGALDIAVAHRHWGLDPVTRLNSRSRAFDRRGAKFRDEAHDPLPYRLDRNEQEEELKRAMLEHHSSSPRRPLICVVHGAEEECHREFVERLGRIFLPDTLSSWYPQKVKRVPLLSISMKVSMKKIADKNWEAIFWGDLGEGIIGDRLASPDDIVKLVCGQKVGVIVHAPLLSEELDGLLLDRLHFFFEFWNRWQNIPEQLLLIVCLSLKFQDRYEVKRSRYQIWKSEGLNDRLRTYVTELDFRTYENVHGVCLPQLEAISQTDAETAVNDELVSLRYGLTESDVRRIYKQSNLCTPKGRIPMDTLLDQFSVHSRSAGYER